jgi:hypothetical protein
MPKKKSDAVADEFSNHEMEQIKRYGEALSGGVTPFDEEVERYLNRCCHFLYNPNLLSS